MITAKTTINLRLFKMPLQLVANVTDTTVFEAYSDFGAGAFAPDLDAAIAAVCRQLNIAAFLETEVKIDAVYARYSLKSKRLYVEGIINLPNSKASLILNFQPSENEILGNDFAIVLDLNFGFNLQDLPVISKNQIDENLRLSLAFANYSGEFETIPFGTEKLIKTRKIKVKSGIQLQPNIELPKETFHFNYELLDFTPKEKVVNLKKNVTDLPKLPEVKGTKWFDLNQSIGGLTLRKVGVQWQKSKATILLNLDYLSNGLEFSMLGLKASSPLSLKTFKPIFDLHGISVYYKNDLIELGGALLRNDKTPRSYIGKMLLRLSAINIAAIGGFSKTKTGENSFFAFANTNLPIGGVPAFFVRGISVGFGYNSTLNLPEPNQISNFPLLNMMESGEQNPSDALAVLGDFVNEKMDEKWLAAGVNFTSFQLIKGNLILAYEFAKKQVNILGIARLILPTEKAAYLNLQFGLKSIYRIQQGEIQSNTQIQNGSYLIHKGVNLTGSLAIYTWLKGENAGDFVLTIGGYHPKYQRPAHFPEVPKVGFNWKVSETTKMEGKVYFALTNQAIMTGFNFEATYEKGRLKAYFKASSNMILQWKPFYYDFQTQIRLGATYQSHFLKNYKLDIGAKLHLFGPETGGFIKVNWSIISFNIRIGNPEKARFIYVLDWGSFQNSFLPIDKKDIIKINIHQNDFNNTISLNTQSLIPSNELKINDLSVEKSVSIFGIRPMNKQELLARQSLKIINRTTKEIIDFNYKIKAKKQNFPAAIWSAKPLNTKALNNEKVNAISGFDSLELIGKPIGDLATIPTAYFEGEVVQSRSKFESETIEVSSQIEKELATILDISDSINSEKIVQNRTSIITALNQILSIDNTALLPNEPLKKLAKNAERIFQSEPKIGQISKGNAIVAKAKTVQIERQKRVEVVRAIVPKLMHYAKGNSDKIVRAKSTLENNLKSRSIETTSIEEKVIIKLGSVYIFDLNENQVNQKVEFTSEVSIQIMEFDMFNNLIQFDVLEKNKTAFIPSKNAKRLALKGISLKQKIKPKFTAWTANQNLPLVNSNALLGDGFYLKMQVPIQEDERVVASVSELEKQNYIQTIKDTEKGFVDTLVFKDYREIVVVLSPKNSRIANIEKAKKGVELSIPFVYKNGFERVLKDAKVVLKSRAELIDENGNIRLKFRLSNQKLNKNSKMDESWNGFALRLKIRENWEVNKLFLFEKRVKKSIWKIV